MREQSPVGEGVTPRDPLLETIELARHVDALGYRRYCSPSTTARPASRHYRLMKPEIDANGC